MKCFPNEGLRVLAGAVFLASFATACGERSHDARTARSKVRISTQAYLSNAVIHIGVRDSVFAQHGLDVEIVPMNPTDAFPLLFSGRLDAVAAPITPAMLNAMAAGEMVRIVAARNYYDAGRCTVLALMRAHTRQAREAGHTTISIGKELSQQYYTETALSRLGVRMDTMQVTNLIPASGFEALMRGGLDYFYAGEPWVTRALDAGAVRWISIDSVFAGAQYGFLLYGPSILKDNRELGHRFMAAYLEAVARYQQGVTPRNLDIIAAVTGERADLLKRACWASVTGDGRLHVEDVMNIQKWAVGRGYVKRPATVGQFWDSSFVANAGKPSSR